MFQLHHEMQKANMISFPRSFVGYDDEELLVHLLLFSPVGLCCRVTSVNLR